MPRSTRRLFCAAAVRPSVELMEILAGSSLALVDIFAKFGRSGFYPLPQHGSPKIPTPGRVRYGPLPDNSALYISGFSVG